MRYHRSQDKGATFFFTLVTYQRRPLFADTKNIDLLRHVIRDVKCQHPFNMNAFVILPDHLHCIWTLPSEDNNFSMRWRLIKSNFTREYVKRCRCKVTAARTRKQEQCVWQRRFWEHQIRDNNDFARHLDYIHYNPVKHGYVQTPSSWLYSSFHHYVNVGVYPSDWTQVAQPQESETLGE